MSAPVVTVLLPVKHYDPGFLREAVDSVRGQDNPDWRLLVIARRPQRTRVADDLAEQLTDPRIDLVPGRGRHLAGQLNMGMRAADSEYVAIVLGDDVWTPDAVEVLARNIAAHPDVDFFHSARRPMDAEGRLLGAVLPSQPEVSLPDFGADRAPVKHLLCWRRELALEIGGMDESLRSVGVDDFDFPWSMAEHGARFRAIPECLYVFRDHREHFRLTTHLPRSHHKREIARILRKHGVDRATIARRIADAERGYLRQCLYRSRWDRWVKRARGFDVRDGWREPYA
jgi:O-antigen biosynthesis protein